MKPDPITQQSVSDQTANAQRSDCESLSGRNLSRSLSLKSKRLAKEERQGNARGIRAPVLTGAEGMEIGAAP